MEFDYNSKKWKHKRACILRRDNYQCRECRRYGRLRSAEEVHHIKFVEDYPELAFVDSNLISLCGKCHRKKHPEKAKAAQGRY